MFFLYFSHTQNYDGKKEPGQTVLVAGATGGVGQLLTAKLLDRGFKVKALTRSREKTESLLGSAPGLEVVYGDMREKDTLPQALEGVDAVACCTGTTAFPSKRWDGGNTPENTDYIGVRNLIDATPKSVSRFVLTTSAGVDRSGSFPFIILNAFGVSCWLLSISFWFLLAELPICLQSISVHVIQTSMN